MANDAYDNSCPFQLSYVGALIAIKIVSKDCITI